MCRGRCQGNEDLEFVESNLAHCGRIANDQFDLQANV